MIKPKSNRVNCSVRIKNKSMSGVGTKTIARFHLKCFKKKVGDIKWKSMMEKIH